MKLSTSLTAHTLLAIWISQALGAIHESISDVPDLAWDFIVIGGGTAGNVIASRLTENSKVNVLVLESGISNDGQVEIEVPFYAPLATPQTTYDWNYTTIPQPGIGGRAIPYPRGHVLGGSSSVNYMVYTRGSTEDFDRYAAVTGDSGWSWENALTYFKKTEKFVQPLDGHNITAQFEPSVHGFSGLVEVTLPNQPQSIDSRMIATTQQLAEFPFNLDQNDGSPIGIGWQQGTNGEGYRWSSAVSFYGGDVLQRANLHVVVQAQVTRILQNSQSVFDTVEFSQNGNVSSVQASKEIILSAGGVGSPQVLLNSGIGNQTELSAIGVTTVLDLPSVGKNLSDHPVVSFSWYVNGTGTFADFEGTEAHDTATNAWNESPKAGPLTDTVFNHIGWIRLAENDTIWTEYSDPSAGPNTPHFEVIISNGLSGPNPPAGNYLAASALLATVHSRGSITINSTNPLDYPIIDPNVLSSPFDQYALTYAWKSIQRFVAAPAWSDYIVSPVGALANVTTDEELLALLKTEVGLFHIAGTCSFSPKGADWGVVDPDLTLKNATGVRVIDASVLNYAPAAHPQAAVYVIAERGADLIKEKWSL